MWNWSRLSRGFRSSPFRRRPTSDLDGGRPIVSRRPPPSRSHELNLQVALPATGGEEITVLTQLALTANGWESTTGSRRRPRKAASPGRLPNVQVRRQFV